MLGNAILCHELRVYLFADGGDYAVSIHLNGLAGLNGAAASGSVHIAQLHLIADKLALCLLYGGSQLHELYAVLNCKLQLLKVGGHVLAVAAIDQCHLFNAGHPLCGTGGIHCGIAAANHGNVLAKVQLAIIAEGIQEVDNVDNIALDGKYALLLCAAGQYDLIESICLKGGGIGGFLAHYELYAVFLDELNVLIDSLFADAEGRDNIAYDTAKGLTLFKYGYCIAGFCREVCSSKACGAAADNGKLAVGGFNGLGKGHQLIIGSLCRYQLGAANIHGGFVVIAHALIHAVMCADGAGDEGQGVLVGDDLESLKEQALAAQLNVFGNILAEGAAALAGCLEAVGKGQHLILAHGALGGFLYGLYVILVGNSLLGKLCNGLVVHAVKGLEFALVKELAKLYHAAVSAGLKDGGGHGDGPDACLKEGLDVEEVCAAAVGQAKLTLELVGKAVCHFDSEGIQ